MNGFERGYTKDRQRESRQYYAELCQERANSHLASAERNEKRGDLSYANIDRSLAIFDAKRKKEWQADIIFIALLLCLYTLYPVPVTWWCKMITCEEKSPVR